MKAKSTGQAAQADLRLSKKVLFFHISQQQKVVSQTAVLFEPRCEKTGIGVSDQVRHKPGCTATGDG